MTVGASVPRVGWDVLKDFNRKALFDALDAIGGSKTLVWDSDLLKPFGLIADVRELKAHGVSEMFTIQRGPVPALPVEHVVFICRPTLSNMELIAENLRSQRKDDSRQLHLLFTPRQAVICENKLDEVDARQKFMSIGEIPVFFYPSETDVASMEEPDLLPECLVYDDKTALHTVAMGLKQIENLYGPLANVSYKGNLAQEVYRLFVKERQNQDESATGESGRSSRPLMSSRISNVIILDRMLDPLTPMITQLTYEGLIDEIFEIKCARAKFPKEKFTSEGNEQSGAGSSRGATENFRNLQLNSDEELYQDLRDLNFNSVPATLSTFVKNISQEQEERHKATTVHEMKEFVKRLPYLQAAKKSAAVHMTVAELIKDVTTSERFIETITAEHEILNDVDTDKALAIIEDGMAKGEPWIKIVRLMCLQSLATDGLPAKVYDQYRREFLQSYGYHLLPLLCKLQKAEFLRSKTTTTVVSTATSIAKGVSATGGASRFSFAPIKRTLRLLVEDVNEHNPNDLSYVYSGYAPLSSRLCAYFLKPGWKIIGENLKRLAGATGIEEESQKQRRVECSTRGQDEKKVILVVYVGGITYAEISALRFLSNQQEENTFLILTTGMVNGDRLIHTFN